MPPSRSAMAESSPIMNALTFSDAGAGGVSATGAGTGTAVASLGSSAVFEHAASATVAMIATNEIARTLDDRLMWFLLKFVRGEYRRQRVRQVWCVDNQ